LRWRTESDPITQLLRNGLLVTDGDAHDTIRKLMNPALHQRALPRYVEAMWRSVDVISARWDTAEPLDMLVEMRRVALLVTIETLFGVNFSPEIDRLWQAILKVLTFIAPGLWMMWAGIPRPGYQGAITTLGSYLQEVITLRRGQLGDNAEGPDDLLGQLIHAGLSDALIRDQMMTMIVAGHDTVTAMLAWTAYVLGKHTDVQARVHAELDQAWGDQPPQMDQLKSLPYLDNVINESMRLHPPVHLGSRVANTDLAFGGYTIRRGSRVTYSIYVTHRMTDYWESPLEFDPDRFSKERSKGRPNFAFIPFGGGERICIGTLFARVEAKAILGRLLQRYRITLLQPTIHEHMGATLEPRPGVIVRLTRR
jgi:cytochrome P450